MAKENQFDWQAWRDDLNAEITEEVALAAQHWAT